MKSRLGLDITSLVKKEKSFVIPTGGKGVGNIIPKRVVNVLLGLSHFGVQKK